MRIVPLSQAIIWFDFNQMPNWGDLIPKHLVQDAHCTMWAIISLECKPLTWHNEKPIVECSQMYWTVLLNLWKRKLDMLCLLQNLVVLI
jgi:hypothetical protein